MTRAFDAIIVGAGQAGPPLAARLTGAGMTVALIERHLVGGTCVNTGCMPTKTMVASAYAAQLARRAGDFGVRVGDVSVDMKAVTERARGVTLNARTGGEQSLETMKRLTFLRGHARFTSPCVIAVGEQELTAPRIFLNVGGRASVPDMPCVGTVPHLDNTDMVAIQTTPEHLVVVGGSYVGLEFAQMFRRFGAEVTIVERNDRLIAREDPEISDAIGGILEGEGIAVRTGAECIAFAAHDRGVAVSVDCRDGEPSVVGSHVLLAVGRRPNTEDLGLDRAGIATDARGYIVVDNMLQTSMPGVWALGDCNGRGAFTHTAYNDFEIVAANLLDGAHRTLAERIPGYALYTDPPLGRVGMTEAEAVASGKRVLVASRPMTKVGRAIEKGETNGLMKVVVDADTQRILGAAILGTGGDEAIHGVLDMINANQSIDTLRWAVPIHPTVSELIPTLLGDLAPAATS
ncbi:FAD-containing oxidoreductase [Sphingomonas sp. SUN019]|uniref:FAD-containing oxidoreductase n=1 Tax=Sphingomonas sp. SUN019 TaxID=2937788 RepID=UPI0021643649|nr:FAD-containing oxidoreductase [Sphingomonas sp. SUN019]UVO50204.1 FAD-containing oxidoreductase [Sphingomonas sp. SUN019]